MDIPMKKVLLPDSDIRNAKRLIGFDYGDHLYHVVLFCDDSGAVGVYREGSNFCARITLDALAQFAEQAHAEHIQGNA